MSVQPRVCMSFFYIFFFLVVGFIMSNFSPLRTSFVLLLLLLLFLLLLFLLILTAQHMKDLTPEILNEIDRLVAPDVDVYNHGRHLFQEQAADFGGRFDEVKQHLNSPPFLAECERRRPELKASCKSMRR